MLELKKREVEVKMRDGSKVTMNFPTAKRMQKFLSDIKEFIKGDLDKTDYDLTVELLVESGMSQDQVDELYGEDMKELIAVLDGQKKI